MNLFSDAAIAGVKFDALGRKDVATRIVDLVAHAGAPQPLVFGLVGPSGCGKTSILRMAGELFGERDEFRAFTLDAWAGNSASQVNDSLLRELSGVFTEGRVVSTPEKLRERLFSLGDMVSTVARVAGVTVDVKGALARTDDQLKVEVMKLTEALGKRIVVFVDHLDRLPGAEAVALLKLIERWGGFPYFAFVLGFDHDQIVRNLRHVDGDADALEHIVTTELAVPPADRARLAAWVRGGLSDLAASLGVDPAPALALFDVEVGVGLEVAKTVRHAKRLLNAMVASAPLLRHQLGLRDMCLLEMIRQRAPDAHRAIAERLPLDAELAARLRGEPALASAPYPIPRLIDSLLADQVT